MVSKIEDAVGEARAQNSESQTEEQIRQESEALPNFEALTQQETDEWVNN